MATLEKVEKGLTMKDIVQEDKDAQSTWASLEATSGHVMPGSARILDPGKNRIRSYRVSCSTKHVVAYFLNEFARNCRYALPDFRRLEL